MRNVQRLLVILAILAVTVAGMPVRSAAAIASWPVVQQGNSGPHVKAIQFLLRHRGYTVTADGVFGSGTRSQVIAFQSSNGLVADGIVGGGTWAKLVVQLDYASQGAAVSALEIELGRHGYYMQADTNYGAATRYAVLDFKGKHGLGGGAVVGVTSWQEIVGSNTIDKTSTSSYLTQNQAAAQFSSVGITWTSSGNCTDRNNGTCTSFDGLLSGTASGLVAFKSGSGCPINVTGGTETGHQEQYDFPFTHTNGHKIDITSYNRNIFGQLSDNCATTFIKANFTYIGKRYDLDNAPLYVNSRGDLYALESNHWDITYYSYN